MSKIYKMVCDDGYYYIGSTTLKYLSKRFCDHKFYSKKECAKTSRVYTHIASIGWDRVKIILIETLSCADSDELRMREDAYIVKAENDPLCLNHNRAFLTDDERITRKKESKEAWKAKKNAIVRCECGIEHTVGRTTQHRSSVKHKEAMAILPE